jgi:hypothetical protein
MNNLAAKIKAVNTANAVALDLFDELSPVFQPLIGRKVCKTDGELFKKYASVISPIVEDLYYYDYTLIWIVKSCVTYPDGGCVYYETSVRIGSICDGVLTSVNERPVLRTDYSESEVMQALKQYAEAKAVLSAIAAPYQNFEEFFRR